MMLQRILAVITVSALMGQVTHTAPSQAHTISTWDPDRLSRTLIGGGVSDVAVADDGQLYIASERQVLVYSGAGTENHAEFDFPVRVSRVVASASRLVVELENADLHILDLDTRRWSTLSRQIIPNGESISAIEIVDRTMAIGTSAGSILTFDMTGPGEPTIAGRVSCNQIVAGDWWIMSMAMTKERVFAALYDRSQSPPKGALISIGRAEDHQWHGESIALFEKEQAQKLIVVGETALVQLTTGILKIDLQSGLVTQANLQMGENRYIQAMAAQNERMYLVIRADHMPTDNSMTLSSVDISNPEVMTTLSSVTIDYEIGNSDLMVAWGDQIYKAGADEVRVFAATDGIISSAGQKAIVIPIVTSAVEWGEDEVIVGRQGGVCRVEVSSSAQMSCFVSGRGADKLLRVQGFLVSVDGAEGIWSAGIGGGDIAILDHVEADVPYYRYVDAATSSGGFISVLDTNQPRTTKTRFRLEHWVIDATGSMNKSGVNDIETPDCGPAQVRLSISGEWLGLLCGNELIEYTLRDNDVAPLGSVDLAARGADVDVDADGVMVIGTSAGLVVYDSLHHQTTAVKPPTGVPSAGVLAVKASKDGIFVVHGGSTGTRSLYRYYIDQGAYETEEILAYDRSEGRPQNVRIVNVGDGIVLVTGSRVAIYLRPASFKETRLLLPLVLRQRAPRLLSTGADMHPRTN